MKFRHAIAATLATVLATFAVAACEVPEDDGKTAADRVQTKDAAKKDAKNKSAGKQKGDNKTKGQKAGAEDVEQVVEEEPAAEEKTETAGQAQARQSAEAYLDYSAFSRKGLIEQLEYEGFSTKDATYGTDAQDANWNDQAALSAKQYLDMSSFSRQGLIEQLQYEGYTVEQATFGVTKVGL